MKICLISSSGGHLAQLKQLLPIAQEHELFIVTEKNKSTASLEKNFKTYFLNQQERKNISFIWDFSSNIFKSISIVLKEKPDVIISTGAGAVIPLCFFGKLFNSKVIFIESFAKINSPTITGRIIYKFADRFYIQWEELREYYPKAEYKGVIY
ncbi:MAG: PssD/Cps14F family polysaccharide biosynthesis glycosyltransferase [Bacillota bacterium]